MLKKLLPILWTLALFSATASPADPSHQPDSDFIKIQGGPLQKKAESGDPNAQFNLTLLYDITQDHNKAVYWYTKAAEQGIAGAQYNLALLYHEGQGVPQDYNKAAYWYTKAAEQGIAEAQFNLALLYHKGQGVPQDYNKAVYWYTKAAEQGDTKAQYNLAVLYHNGQGVPQDYNKAVYWYTKAAEQGFANAQFNLALLYDKGEGVPRDYNKAVYWYTKAAEQGSADAQYNLAVLYYNGQGVPRDYNKAVYWYTKAAAGGFAKAQYNLALLYDKGEGVPQDYNKAVYWYTKAAEQEHAEAQYNLALSYENGEGVPQDYNKAAYWYTKAAEQGYAKAQFNLALLCDKGEGVPQDYNKAVYWYTKATAQGFGKAQLALALLYYKGQGVIEDYVEAYKWLLLAGKNGQDVSSLKEMLRPRMTPAQVVEARNRAREFVRRRHPQPAADASPSPGAPDSTTAFGTAFFISPSGYLLTAHHVTQNAKKISIITSSATYPARLVFSDPTLDVAVLKAEGAGFAHLDIVSSAQVRVGDHVWTLGYPNIVIQGTEPKYTEGTISSLTGPADNIRYFQVTVPVQPGNSGGPLLDRSGRVVGVVVSRLSDIVALAVTGSIPQNVNYAVKSVFVLPILDSIPALRHRAKNAPRTPLNKSELIEKAARATALVVCY